MHFHPYVHESKKIVQLEKAKMVICAAYKKISSSARLQFVNSFENIFMTEGIKSGKTDLTLLFSTYLRVRSLISL